MTPQTAAEPDSRLVALASLSVTLVVLILRQDSSDLLAFVQGSLWAEDGNVFLSELFRDGPASIWNEYAGYLHLYPRLVTLTALVVDLVYVPWIFLFAAIMAVWFMMHIIMRALVLNQAGLWLAIACALLIGLQPNLGQIFFTATNAQWFLSVALCVIAAVPGALSGPLAVPLVAALCLTGPFSVLTVPVVLLRCFFDRPLDRRQIALSAVVVLCAAIQIWFILESGRGSDPVNLAWKVWLRVLFDSFTFGGDNVAVMPLSVAYWSVVAALVVLLLKGWWGSRELHATTVTTFCLIVAAGCMFVGGLWAFKHTPGALNPIFGNARYYFAPYGMIVLALALNHRLYPVLTKAGLLIFALICVLQFKSVSRESLAFPSYAAFAKVHADLVIPVTPLINHYPGWHINTRDAVARNARSADHHLTGDALSALQTSDDSVSVPYAQRCPDSAHIGLELVLERAEEGLVTISWGGQSDERITRFYGAGAVRTQFAFPNEGDGTAIVSIGTGRAQQMDLYCLN